MKKDEVKRRCFIMIKEYKLHKNEMGIRDQLKTTFELD